MKRLGVSANGWEQPTLTVDASESRPREQPVSIPDLKQVEALGGGGGRSSGTGAGGEDFFQVGHRKAVVADFDQGSHKIPDHSVKKTVPVEA